jgi:hypothetical protein
LEGWGWWGVLGLLGVWQGLGPRFIGRKRRWRGLSNRVAGTQIQATRLLRRLRRLAMTRLVSFGLPILPILPISPIPPQFSPSNRPQISCSV